MLKYLPEKVGSCKCGKIKEAGGRDHIKAEKLFQNEAPRDTDTDLKKFAARTLPAIREHLRMAREITSAIATAATEKEQAEVDRALCRMVCAPKSAVIFHDGRNV